MNPTIEELQRREREFWRNSIDERPESDSVQNIIDKVRIAAVFMEVFTEYMRYFPITGRILELGAGQGWASCLVKRFRPHAEVIATDISEDALRSIPKWQPIWKAFPDSHYSCTAQATLEKDLSVDTVFCFASAHHFVEHDKVMVELCRILKAGGTALYFYEPTTPEFWYPVMYRRVNKRRNSAPEDVLVPARLERIARNAGLDVTISYYPSTKYRGPIETIYFSALGAFPFLARVLPCTANIVIKKPH